MFFFIIAIVIIHILIINIFVLPPLRPGKTKLYEGMLENVANSIQIPTVLYFVRLQIPSPEPTNCGLQILW